MELRLIARILRRWWWLVVIPVAITVVLAVPLLLRRGAASGGFTTTISYTASQSMTAIPGRDGDYQDVWLASELAVNALTDWVRSNTFSANVSAWAGEQGVLIKDTALLGISADNERSVGQIFISWPDADQLGTIAQGAINVLEHYNDTAFPQMGGVPAEVRILNNPVIVPAPPPLTDRFAPLIRIALGLLAGIALAFLAHYLDPVLRGRDDLESLGLPVVASIPRK